MSLNHGINTYKSDTNFASVQNAVVGIPFFVGAWPCHTADGFVNKPQIATNFGEAVKIGGYSKEWRDKNGNPKWNLCQAMYSHFKLFKMGPAIFYNIFDPTKHKTSISDKDVAIVDHIAVITGDAIDNDNLIVKNEAATLEKNKDYEIYYNDDSCVVELLESGSAYKAVSITVSYDEADISSITATDIEAAIEKIEECKTLFGIDPDLICCPGWSQTPSVAAVMAVKAQSINGLFKGKAVVDLDTDSSNGADIYSKVFDYKNENGYIDENMIVCWPLANVGDYIFDYSVIVCGLIASVDSGNGACPYESPSNKSIPITGLCDKAGNEINLSTHQADIISYSAGVVTAINFDGWKAWGNYTACWPDNKDVSKHFICTNRMMDFICNTFVNMFWSYLDRPLTRVMIDAIVNSFNSWLDGLTHDGKLCGGQIEYVNDNNPADNLIAGKFRLDTKIASPVPAQEIDMYAEFDMEILTSAFSA